MKYSVIDRHAVEHPIRRLSSVMAVLPSGYYAWKQQSESNRLRLDPRLTPLIHQFWEESGQVYRYRKSRDDLRDLGEHCRKHRVARLMQHAGLGSHTGYGRRAGTRGGNAAPSMSRGQLPPQRPGGELFPVAQARANQA